MMLSEEFLSPLVDENFIYSTSNIFHNTFDSICHLIRQNRKHKYYTAKEYIRFSPLTVSSLKKDVLFSLDTLTDSLINATLNNYPGSEFIVAGLVSRFFSVLEDKIRFRKEIFHLIDSNTEKLMHQITHIFESQNGNVSRNELESIMHYNADYLNRIVKKSTGLTLTEYRQIFSLQQASILLCQSDMTISDIVSNLGFSNRTYFNKIFISKYGMPPSQYREKNKVPSIKNHSEL